MSSGFNSALYTGWVRHRRYTRVKNELKYRVFMMFLDLDEIDDIMALNPLWRSGSTGFALARFLRSDYFAADTALDDSAQDLKESVTRAFRSELNENIVRVCLLTNMRYFGYLVNPVSFYFGYRRDGSLAGILAEITNTPWGERHHYTLNTEGTLNTLSTLNTEGKLNSGPGIHPQRVHSNSGTQRYEYRFKKNFHVSPFNPMDMQYRWVLNDPDDELLIHMDTLTSTSTNTNANTTNTSNKESAGANLQRDFDATMRLSRKEITPRSLSAVLIRFPFMTLKVLWGIYWNALKLWVRGSRFYDHPGSVGQSEQSTGSSKVHPEDIHNKIKPVTQPDSCNSSKEQSS